MNLIVISSNIRFANSQDGIHQWQNRLPILSKIINNHSPSILATQEGHEPQLRELSKFLPKLKLIDSNRKWLSERMYPCIFINPDIIKVTNNGDFWLSETPSIAGSLSFKSAFPRLCNWAICNLNNNHKFIFANTHLDHIKPSTREGQINVLVKELKKINTENLPIILAGDFNESPSHKNRKLLMEGLNTLYDPWLILNKNEEGSHHSFENIKQKTQRIDWILVDNSLKAIKVELDKSRINEIWPSDHFPLILNLDI